MFFPQANRCNNIFTRYKPRQITLYPEINDAKPTIGKRKKSRLSVL